MGFIIEYGEGHKYRIIAPNGQKGIWSNYTEVAVIEIDNKMWIAFSEYFEGWFPKEFPTNKVFPVGKTTIPTKIMQNN